MRFCPAVPGCQGCCSVTVATLSSDAAIGVAPSRMPRSRRRSSRSSVAGSWTPHLRRTRSPRCMPSGGARRGSPRSRSPGPCRSVWPSWRRGGAGLSWRCCEPRQTGRSRFGSARPSRPPRSRTRRRWSGSSWPVTARLPRPPAWTVASTPMATAGGTDEGGRKVSTDINWGAAAGDAIRFTDQIDARALARQEQARDEQDREIKAILERAEERKYARPLQYWELEALSKATAAKLEAQRTRAVIDQVEYKELMDWAVVAGAQRAAEITAERAAASGRRKSAAQLAWEQAQLDEVAQRKVLSGYERFAR